MSNLIDFAQTELAALRGDDTEPDEMQDMVDKCVLDIVNVFSEQGHSGSSAAYVTGIVEKVLRYEPVTPLTGADGEWVEVMDGIEQNRRCPHVFRENGQAYDGEARIFREPDGFMYTSRDSRVDITFPYTPTREIVDVPASEH